MPAVREQQVVDLIMARDVLEQRATEPLRKPWDPAEVREREVRRLSKLLGIALASRDAVPDGIDVDEEVVHRVLQQRYVGLIKHLLSMWGAEPQPVRKSVRSLPAVAIEELATVDERIGRYAATADRDCETREERREAKRIINNLDNELHMVENAAQAYLARARYARRRGRARVRRRVSNASSS